MLHLFEQKSI